MRQGPKPSVRAPSSWGVAGPSSRDPQLPAVSQAQARWLDVHPSRPNLCALGGSGGLVALWDLRMHAAPLAATVGASEVWEVSPPSPGEVLCMWMSKPAHDMGGLDFCANLQKASSKLCLDGMWFCSCVQK